MTVATLQMVLVVSGCHSQREKRKLMREMMGTLHRHFNVSVAEVDRGHNPAEARLAVVAIGRSRWEVRATLTRVADAVAVYPHAELVSRTITLI